MKKEKSSKFFIFVVIIFAMIIALMLMYLYNDFKKLNTDKQTIKHVATEVLVEPKLRNGLDENLLRSIDFNTLQSQNSDAVKWLYVPGTKIDAPVMQEIYVNRYFYNLRGFNGRYNGCGSFLIPAEPKDEHGNIPDDAHTLILGHRMNNYNGEWQFSNLPLRWGSAKGASEYPFVYLYQKDKSVRYRVWAAIDVTGYDEIYDIPYTLKTREYAEMLDHVKSVSRYTTMPTPPSDMRTLFLSTCNQDYRGFWQRFCLVCVPDAEYYYKDEKYVNIADSYNYEKWKEKVEKGDNVEKKDEDPKEA